MTAILHARFDQARIAKVEQIQRDTGLTVSQLFRRLIDAAEVKPAEIKVNLSQKANSDTTLAGNGVAVRA
jgi:hypothetical protein